MKIKLISSIALFLIFCFTSLAVGALTIDNQANMQFYADNNDHNSNANITIGDFNIFGNFEALQYNVADNGWNDYNSREFTITTGSSAWRSLVELQIKTDNNYMNSADKKHSIVENLPGIPNRYDSLRIYWTKFSSSSIKINIVNNNNRTDDLLPVTMQGVAWFLGAGLIGLVGVRRRWMV